MLKPVDTAIIVVVGPCIDDTDFKTVETGIAYNASGMSVDWVQEKTDGTTVKTDLTLTSGGVNDWTHVGNGYYSIEITAVQNNEEGVGYATGSCTGVLPFESPRYDIVPTAVYDSVVKGTDKLQVDVSEISSDSTAADNLELMFDGTGYAGGTTKLDVNVTTIEGSDATNQIRDAIVDDATRIDATALNTLSAKAPSKSYLTGTSNSDGDIQMDEATGNFSGSVASVAGNVSGNVTGSVGSVATGGITASSIATNAIDADSIAADAITEIQSGLATSTSLTTVEGKIDTVDTVVDAIKAKTDNLPASPAAVGSAMTLAAGAITAATIATDAIDADSIAASAITEIQTGLATSTSLTTVEGKVDTIDTVVDAIKAKTDNLPASPAAVGSAMTLSSGAITAAVIATNAIDADAIASDAVTEIQSGLATSSALTAVEGKIDTVDTVVDAIKAKTDNLPASPAAVGSAMTLSSGAITAAVIATDAIDSDALASSAITEIQSGLATSSVLTTVEGKVDTIDTVVDAIKAKTDNLPASPAAVGSEMTLSSSAIDSIWDETVDVKTARQILKLLFGAFFGLTDGGGTTTITVKAQDGVTTIATKTQEDNGDTTNVVFNV